MGKESMLCLQTKGRIERANLKETKTCVWVCGLCGSQRDNEVRETEEMRKGQKNSKWTPEKSPNTLSPAPPTHLGLVPRGVRCLDPGIETQCTGHVALVECSVSQRHVCLLKQRTMIWGPGRRDFRSWGAIFGEISEGVPFGEDVDYYVPIIAAPLQKSL